MQRNDNKLSFRDKKYAFICPVPMKPLGSYFVGPGIATSPHFQLATPDSSQTTCLPFRLLTLRVAAHSGALGPCYLLLTSISTLNTAFRTCLSSISCARSDATSISMRPASLTREMLCREGDKTESRTPCAKEGEQCWVRSVDALLKTGCT